MKATWITEIEERVMAIPQCLPASAATGWTTARVAGLLGPLHSIVRAWRQARREAVLRRMLTNLPPHIAADIGHPAADDPRWNPQKRLGRSFLASHASMSSDRSPRPETEVIQDRSRCRRGGASLR